MRDTESQLGPIGILVNNAGINPVKSFDQITAEDWDETIRVNLSSAFHVTQAALPGLRTRKWGRIIIMSSVAAQTAGVIGPHYAASKAGLIGLAHSYAALLAKEGITSNVIAPALIETDKPAMERDPRKSRRRASILSARLITSSQRSCRNSAGELGQATVRLVRGQAPDAACRRRADGT